MPTPSLRGGDSRRGKPAANYLTPYSHTKAMNQKANAMPPPIVAVVGLGIKNRLIG